MSVASSMPMGWGTPTQSTTEKFDDEQRAYEGLQAIVPQRLMRAAPKIVLNEPLVATVRALMQQDGMPEGFSMLHLHEAIMGKQPDWKPQLIGSCVASGDKETTAARALGEVFLFNEPEQIPGTATTTTDNLSFFAPFNYRAGRKLAGINGNSDGSLCLPHIRGKMQYGHLPCNAASLQSDAFPEPQAQPTYRAWGAGDNLLNQFKNAAAPFVLLESESVETPEESRDLLTIHYKPQNICSDWAFKRGPQHPTWRTRDGRPVHIWVRDTGDSWAHNMSRMGYVLIGTDWFCLIKNTWGNFHDGRTWFPISQDTDERWLPNAECQSVGNLSLGKNPVAWPES